MIIKGSRYVSIDCLFFLENLVYTLNTKGSLRGNPLGRMPLPARIGMNCW